MIQWSKSCWTEFLWASLWAWTCDIILSSSSGSSVIYHSVLPEKSFPFSFPKDFLQCSQKQPEILPEFSEFYSLRACFCLAIIPTTESCEKARADRVVSALPALKVNLRHWERKHLRNNLPDPAGIGIFSQRNSSWFELELYTSKLFWNIDLLQNVR